MGHSKNKISSYHSLTQSDTRQSSVRLNFRKAGWASVGDQCRTSKPSLQLRSTADLDKASGGIMMLLTCGQATQTVTAGPHDSAAAGAGDRDDTGGP